MLPFLLVNLWYARIILRAEKFRSFQVIAKIVNFGNGCLLEICQLEYLFKHTVYIFFNQKIYELIEGGFYKTWRFGKVYSVLL